MIHETENQHSAFEVHIHSQRRNICAEWDENKSQALKIFVHEQRQTLIYTTQSAGSSTELTNQLAREQI